MTQFSSNCGSKCMLLHECKVFH
uniref:Uncharacterized protein n=1 Tax=Arundo donax TaxID=35708 RepID=A0A0A8YSH9_ARUDO